MRWEYKCARFGAHEMRDAGFEQRLDVLGNEGWELLTLLDHDHADDLREAYLLFRRAVLPAQSSRVMGGAAQAYLIRECHTR